MGSRYKAQLNEWKAQQDVVADVLFDIGGAQDPLKGKTKSWDVKDYKIIDLKEPHVETVKPDIAHDMNTPWIGSAQADAIYCLGVFDYVINPNICMDNIRKMLKDDGYAWIEFPFVYAHHNPVMEEGCRYSEGCINRLVKQSRLKITDIHRKMAGNDHLLKFYQEDGHRMAKEYQYHNVTGFIVRVEHE